MKSRVALAVLLACAAAAAAAQSPSSGHPRGSGLQAWQNPGLPAVLAKCKTPPPLNSERLKQVAAANSRPCECRGATRVGTPARIARDSRRDRRGPELEGRLVVGGQ